MFGVSTTRMGWGKEGWRWKDTDFMAESKGTVVGVGFEPGGGARWRGGSGGLLVIVVGWYM